MKKIILIMVLVVLNIFAEQKNYVLVEGGSFDDGDENQVSLDNFYISKYEVT